MELITIGNCTVEAVCQDGMPYANLKRLCDDLGISYPAQFSKLKEARWACVANIATRDTMGRKQEMAFVSADTIPLWLATINANKVADDVKATLYVIQDEAKDVLNRHFMNSPMAPADEIRAMRADVNELQTQYLEVFNRVASVQETQMKQTELMMGYLKRIDDRTATKREEFSSEIKAEYVNCVQVKYSGACPCCHSKTITEFGKKLPYIANFEHYHGRSFNKKEHGWLTCKSCNDKLKNRKPNGYWFQSQPAFLQFQRLLHSTNQLDLFER